MIKIGNDLIIDKITNVKVYTVDENGNKTFLQDFVDLEPIEPMTDKNIVYEPLHTQDIETE